MSYKFKGEAKDYAKNITPDNLKEAFEEYGFEVELKEERYFKGYKHPKYFNLEGGYDE